MCHDSGKLHSFSTKQTAKRFLRSVHLKRKLRVYYCPGCEVWRLTTRRRKR